MSVIKKRLSAMLGLAFYLLISAELQASAVSQDVPVLEHPQALVACFAENSGQDCEMTPGTASASIFEDTNAIDNAEATEFACQNVSQIPIQECDALVALWNNTNGSGWQNRSGWLSNNQPCGWYGISCESGHVSGVSLYRNGLSGILPGDVGRLVYLKELVVSWNALQGKIPVELGELRYLTTLTLEGNDLIGTIPTQLCNLSRLTVLSVTDNSLTGQIPSCLGSLTDLTWLSIFINQLTGEIPPELGNLRKLTFLNLQSNKLTGEIPRTLGNLDQLQALFLHYNQLSGHIPDELGNLGQLQRLSLDSNRLSGPIPSAIGNLRQLTNLRISDNMLAGEIPSSITALTQLGSGHIPLPNTIDYNMLWSVNPVVNQFLDSKFIGWSYTQTVPPSNLVVVQGPPNKLTASWNKISYMDHGGGYEVGVATAPDGPYTVWGRTATKSDESYTIDGLKPGQRYYVAVRTVTPPHDYGQYNLLTSEWGKQVSQVTLSPRITHVEYTQGTQVEDNSVSLVAGRVTGLRVYLDCGGSCTEMHGVTGTLRAYGPSGELPRSPITPINGPITVYQEWWQDQRETLSRTLNFSIPFEWATGTVTFRLEVAGSTMVESRTFVPAQAINIGIVPVRYVYDGVDAEALGERIADAEQLAQKLYPTAIVRVTPLETLTWEGSCFGNYCPGNPCDLLVSQVRATKIDGLMTRLWLAYQFYNASASSDKKLDFVFGWLPENTLGGGISSPSFSGGNGITAIGDDHPTEGPRIFAHEIGHLLGRRHTNTVANVEDSNCALNSCPKPLLYTHSDAEWRAVVDPSSDWVAEDGNPGSPPFSDALIQDPGVNLVSFAWLLSKDTAVQKRTSSYDYMSYCGSLADDNVWTSPWTYGSILKQALYKPLLASPHNASSTKEIWITGVVYQDGRAVLDPAWITAAGAQTGNPPPGTQYCVQLQDPAGVAVSTRCFDLAFVDQETGQPTGVDSFAVVMAYPDRVARISVVQGVQELTGRTVSSATPTVTVVSPNGGEDWSGAAIQTIDWIGSDADNDSISYTVLYTGDGDNWTPLASGITATTLTVKVADLPGGKSGQIRVLATDGVNTSADSSDGPFQVPEKAPKARISIPLTGVNVRPGTPILLQGHAYDLEDGHLPDLQLEWYSDRDGLLGTGASKLVTLSPGWHIILLKARDSSGATGLEQVRVFAGGRVTLPLVSRQ